MTPINNNQMSEELKEIFKEYGIVFGKTIDRDTVSLVARILTLISQERAEAVKDFAIWFEANTGGLYRGEMEAKYKEYLKEQK